MSHWTDLAQWYGTDNHGGAMSEHRGLVVHIAEGYFDGTIEWQRDAPVGQRVSSHFIVGRDGRCAQMVDTDLESWAQKDGNGTWLSVECEGFSTGSPYHKSHPGWEVLTAAQIDRIARLLVKGHTQYGYPLQIATSPAGHGLGHHSMGGSAWGHLDCPGVPIIAQKPAILSRAVALAGGRPRDLVEGDQGDDVRRMQHACNQVPGTGADIAEDGDFGPLTLAKVKRVQAHFGIAVDGIVGPITRGKLGL